MLAFVTSIRAKALARDWGHIVWLLERCLDSLLAQSSPEFRVYVIHHDLPEVSQVADPRVCFIPVSFPLPVRTFDDMLIDKVLKISLGAEAALADGCDFLMYVDADDLVSRRICVFVHENEGDSNTAAWYFDQGYAHRYGSHWLRKQPRHHLFCGTCNIVRADQLQFENQTYYRGGRVEILAAAGHNRFAEILGQMGRVMRPVPFPGSIYILHGDSTVSVQPEADGARKRPKWRQFASRCKHRLKQLPALPELRFLTSGIRAEFSVPSGAGLPPECRSGGLPF